MSTYNEDSTGKAALVIDDTSRKFLLEICKWAKFLSILGFIAVGFMILAAIFAGTLLSFLGDYGGESNTSGAMALSSGFIAALYIVMAIIYIFPFLYLYRFSTRTRTALLSDDQPTFNSGVENLKSHYKFLGILAAIVLIVYAVIFGIGLVGGLMTSL